MKAIVRKRQVRSSRWVSKTDLLQYVRCPYVFSLIARGEIRFDDTLDESDLTRLAEGREFHRVVEAAAPQLVVEPEDISRLFETDLTVYRLPTFENPALKIYGRPDGVEAANGALYPIEAKSHKDVESTDELELAFYWMLLEPLRTRNVDPMGYLILRRDGQAVQVPVPIKGDRLEKVRHLLEEVRTARRRKVPPRICGCRYCRNHPDILRSTMERKDLTLIRDIARDRANRLAGFGIADYEDLLDCDRSAVVQWLHDQGDYVSQEMVEEWGHHARAYQTGSPIIFGYPLPFGRSYISLDLEYVEDLIWLIGVCVVQEGAREYTMLWADTNTQEKRNLIRLGEIVQSLPEIPVVTWAGCSADIPELEKAAKRHTLYGSLDAVFDRHFDAYAHSVTSFRLPIPGFGLKELAPYFSVPRLSRFRSGLHAKLQYLRYRKTTKRQMKRALRNELLDYNRDDLNCLIGVVEGVRSLLDPRRAASLAQDL